MKPLSSHWADIAALKVVNARPDQDCYVIASGITPSGTVHIGNFREVITVDLVGRALRARGKSVRFIYSWDNFDTFRKVPKNLPEPAAFEQYLCQAIARIPDPWGREATYAQGRIAEFEGELSQVGVAPEFLYQEARYSSGAYAKEIRHALEQRDTIRGILNQHRTSELADSWLPTAIYCSQCAKDEMSSERYLGEWQYAYHCAHCQHRETVDIRTTANLKLQWRVDWPMRWFFEKVDFEPGGKDHSSQGGSFDTAKEICQALWGIRPPEYLQYDFVRIKGGGGKMSSSKGELYTLGDALEVYEPEMIRWIFAAQRPNHDFAIAFDEDVIKMYDEFDRFEQAALTPHSPKPEQQIVLRRTYEFSSVEGKLPATLPQRAGFRLLCTRLQVCGGDVERTYQRYYQRELLGEDRQRFVRRAHCALVWLEKYAAEEFCYTLQGGNSRELSSADQAILTKLRQLVNAVDLETITAKDLNDRLWASVIHPAGGDPKAVFSVIYQYLIGRDQGPKLPSFLQEIGKDKLNELLEHQ